MQLTKTDFKIYLDCPESFWLLKNKPDVFAQHKGEFTLFQEKLIRDGYEVEEYAKKLFPNLTDLEKTPPDAVFKAIAKPGNYTQASFLTNDDIFARVDFLTVHEDGSISLFEVKSGTSIQNDRKHRHLIDVAFQRYVLESIDLHVRDVTIIHVDKDFVKDGSIDAHTLFRRTNVSDDVDELYDETVNEIMKAVRNMSAKDILETTCSCREKTRSNRCETFSYFNKNLSKNAIYDLMRMSAKKIEKLRDLSIDSIEDIPEEFKLTPYQSLQRQSVIIGKPIINKESIAKTLNTLTYPLYFFDYETLPFAVPRIDGYKGHQQIPAQYSLHIIVEDGTMTHHEFLAQKIESPENLIASMRSYIGSTGTLISWSASFEKTRNKEMANIYPEHADFLTDINERTFDLMDVFKEDYVDSAFNGSNSIKAVQPILVPDFSYKDLTVQGGTMAVDALERLYEMTDAEEIAQTRNDLFAYCKLDTLAMVEIWKVLKKL